MNIVQNVRHNYEQEHNPISNKIMFRHGSGLSPYSAIIRSEHFTSTTEAAFGSITSSVCNSGIRRHKSVGLN
jgi:hypothetical protein